MAETRFSRLRALAGTRPARYAALFALVTTLVMGTVLALLSWYIVALLERHVEERVAQQLEILRADFAQDGRASLLGLVRRHQERGQDETIHFLVEDAAGRVIAGDLPAGPLRPGWQELRFEDRLGNSLRHRVLAVELGQDTLLAVSSDTADLNRTKWVILAAFGTGLVVTVVLALAGGLLIGRILLRQVDAINRTAEAIMDGDLTRRIPVDDPRDELGQLAGHLNRMLARIEELMENLRHVSNDVAHDLRTPLGRLRQRLEACRLKPRSDGEYALVIDAAIEDIDALLRTFESMLRIAEIEAGAGKSRFAAVSLGEVAWTVCDVFEAVAEDESKLLLARVEEDLWIEGDRELLIQMLANLVENALRHTPEGTSVSVSVDRADGTARLVVSDTGPGIPAEDRERVFRRFYRLDASRSTPGSGLGLSLIGAITRLHNATIELRDHAPGLSVAIQFPAEVPAPPRALEDRSRARTNVVRLDVRPGRRTPPESTHKRGSP